MENIVFSSDFKGANLEALRELLKQLVSMLAVCPSHGKCWSPCWTFNRVLQAPKWN